MTLTSSTEQDSSPCSQFSQEEFIYTMEQTIDAEEAKQQERSLLSQVLSQLRLGMDLTTISCPAFIIMPKSFLELTSDHVCPTKDLLLAPKLIDPVDRILAVTKWIVNSMTLSPQSGLSRMKPYNSVLGEQFCCTFVHEDNQSETKFYSEQVSHHPPISSFHVVNEKCGIHFHSVLQPKVTFYGNSVETILCGKSTLLFDQYPDEEYDIVLPSIVAKGILWGQGNVDIGRSLIVTCAKNQLKVKLDVTKSGVDVEGYLVKDSSNKKLFRIWGNVTQQLYYRDCSTSSNKKKDTTDHSVFIDFKTVKRPEKKVRPVSEQRENESRRVWHHVTHAMYHKDYETASRKKQQVEDAERQKTKLRTQNNINWKPMLFEPNPSIQVPNKMVWHQINKVKSSSIPL
jgi:hypothetical protein